MTPPADAITFGRLILVLNLSIKTLHFMVMLHELLGEKVSDRYKLSRNLKGSQQYEQIVPSCPTIYSELLIFTNAADYHDCRMSVLYSHRVFCQLYCESNVDVIYTRVNWEHFHKN